MNWNDLFRGIAYFKNMAYLAIYNELPLNSKIRFLPLADIACRRLPSRSFFEIA